MLLVRELPSYESTREENKKNIYCLYSFNYLEDPRGISRFRVFVLVRITTKESLKEKG